MNSIEKAAKTIRENGNVPYYFQPFIKPKPVWPYYLAVAIIAFISGLVIVLVINNLYA